MLPSFQASFSTIARFSVCAYYPARVPKSSSTSEARLAQSGKPGELDRDRLVSAAVLDDDASYELKLRPRWLREFIGQQKVKENLAVAIEAAISSSARGRPRAPTRWN